MARGLAKKLGTSSHTLVGSPSCLLPSYILKPIFNNVLSCFILASLLLPGKESLRRICLVPLFCGTDLVGMGRRKHCKHSSNS